MASLKYAALVLSLTLSGCYLATGSSVDAGGEERDADADSAPPSCPEPTPCDHAGIDLEYDMDTEGEAVEVDEDRIVLLGSDGLPQTLRTCGISAEGLVAVGERYSIHHRRVEDDGICWVSTVADAAGVMLVLVARCVGNWELPLQELGWGAETLTSCEHDLDFICSESGEAVYLAIPEEVLDLRLTPLSGDATTISLGETADLDGWRARLLDARLTSVTEGGGCLVPAEGTFLFVAAQEAP